jgi:hypothetical protein
MARITEVTVGYGATFNDPYEQFRNHRPSVTLKMELDDTDRPGKPVAALLEAQREAMAEVEAMRAAILAQRAKEECTCEVCKTMDPDNCNTVYVRRKAGEEPKRTKLCGKCHEKIAAGGEIPF